ncbi:ROK family protein [Streptomyces sp. NPDC018610]|uniref:ROK family transcriptional regulator n=1 Tax=Streptomyces sp. NPDC018610 TaxID=3365049 RepID=UPI0037B494C0
MAEHSGRTVHDLRRESRTAVLQRLYFDGPMSRYSLVPATGLSSGSVSKVVTELITDGLVEEAGSIDSRRGRPRILVRIAPGGGHLIGVDVGETRVLVELFDLCLTELARAERPLERRNGRPHDVGVIVRHINDSIAEVVRSSGVDGDTLLGVGIGVPGIIDGGAEGGVVVHSQTIGRQAVPLEKLLRDTGRPAHRVPYFIDNGAKTLGQAEMWFGAGRGARSAVVVLFGSGVSACVVTDDVERGRAVEWGHLTVQVRGRRCRCGASGCLEAYAGADALLARWREAGGRASAGADEESALVELLSGAYPKDGRAPDPVAATVLAETAEYLGAGLADLINLFQPERILVGGWAGLRLGPPFLQAVRTQARAHALRHPASSVSIELGRLGPDAVTVGAATLPLADFFAHGGRRPHPTDRPTPLPPWQASLSRRLAH